MTHGVFGVASWRKGSHSGFLTRSIGLPLAGALFVAAGAATGKPPAVSNNLSISSEAAEADTLSLNGDWQFTIARGPEEAAKLSAELLASKFNPTVRFQSTPVPSNWALLGYEEPQYKRFSGDASEGFYLKSFTVPKEWSDKRVLLHFGGVWSSAEVWLNGKLLGRYDSGFTSFSFDVSSALKTNSENRLAVRVRQTHRDYEFDANDDWQLGGIYRDVSLEAMPKLRWIDRVDVTTDLDQSYRDADLIVRTMVGDAHRSSLPSNLPAGGANYALRLTLFDAAGQVVKREEIAVDGHYRTGREHQTVLKVSAPNKWTAETPYLYRLAVELIENGQVAQGCNVNVGFREIDTSNGVFRINGQAVKLRGVNRHDEHPDVGRATRPQHWLEDITLMKRANINFVRMAHYPPAKGFLDLADKLGLYVAHEVPMGYGGGDADDPSFANAIMLRSYETVSRDINHPSVIVWGIGNEDPLTSLHMASARTVKALDPTRPVLMPWRSEEWLPKEIDIQAPHYFSTEKFDKLMESANRPVITTEFSHAYGVEGFGDMENRWRSIMRHPRAAGGAIWMWADQGLRLKSGLQVVPDGWDGITDSDRKPTRDYWETQAVYSPVYPTVEAVDVAPDQTDARIAIKNEFDFTNLANVNISWKIIDNSSTLRSGVGRLPVEPHGTGMFNLPLNGLKLRSDRTYFAQLTFLREDKSVITVRSVELKVPSVALPQKKPMPVRLSTDALGAKVNVNGFEIEFSRGADNLIRITKGRRSVINDVEPLVWRDLNGNEQFIIDRMDKTALGRLRNLQSYKIKTGQFKIEERDGKVIAQVERSYEIDAANKFSVKYKFEIDSSANVHVSHETKFNVSAEWLPLYGVTIRYANAPKRIAWTGLGPHDAFPNLTAATYLGHWSEDVNKALVGTKRTRLASVDLGAETSRIRNDGYLRLDEAHLGRVGVLAAAVGRPTKFALAENEAQQIRVTPGGLLHGSFVIELD